MRKLLPTARTHLQPLDIPDIQKHHLYLTTVLPTPKAKLCYRHQHLYLQRQLRRPVLHPGILRYRNPNPEPRRRLPQLRLRLWLRKRRPLPRRSRVARPRPQRPLPRRANRFKIRQVLLLLSSHTLLIRNPSIWKRRWTNKLCVTEIYTIIDQIKWTFLLLHRSPCDKSR